jgi:hypothetical protein
VAPAVLHRTPPRPWTALTAPALPALLAALLAALLGGCGAAQDAVSSATASAKQQAAQKAQDLAVQAFRSQVCSMTADGTLSSAELGRLGRELDTADAAGAPVEAVSAVRALLAKGGSATKAQVRQVHDQTCTS